MTTGGANGKPYRAFRHNAGHDPKARAAMEEARRALDEPGIPPGDEAWALHEERMRGDRDEASGQHELPLWGRA